MLRFCEHISLTFIFLWKVKQTSVFFLSEVLLYIHAVTVTFTCGSCTVRKHSPTVGHWAALQGRWTRIKRVQWPQCISSSVNVKFRFNEHAAAALFVWRYKMLQNILLILLLSFSLKEAILPAVSSSLQLLRGVHSHICHWSISGTEVNKMLPAFNVPAQPAPAFQRRTMLFLPNCVNL